jgi:4-diphosphocytidyl-2-C-methyl-D-erythritol kinase
VCLYGRPAYVSGIGEFIEPAPDLPETHLVLVNPGTPVLTAAVYAALGGKYAAPARFADAPGDARTLAALLARRENALAKAAGEIERAIPELLVELADLDGCLLARLCGSGATCFAMFADKRAAERAARGLARAHRGWWVKATRLLAPGESLDEDD